MNRLKKHLKAVWNYRWEIFISVTVICNIAETVQYLVQKKYELAFIQGMFTFALIVVVLQSKTIIWLGELIEAKDEEIDLQDKLIDKQSNWIERVKKIIEGNSRKMG